MGAMLGVVFSANALLLFIFLAVQTGTFEIPLWIAVADSLQSQSALTWAFLLVLLGAATKFAQFPFHFWLPNVIQALTPVNAYLPSATVVKAGIYLLAWQATENLLAPPGYVQAVLGGQS